MTIGQLIGVAILAVVFLVLTFWPRGATRREKSRIIDMGFKILEPMPTSFASQLLQLAQDTKTLSELYRPWRNRVVTSEVNGVVTAMFDLQHMPILHPSRFWYWAWVCDCPVETLPILITRDDSRIRGMVSNWSVSGAMDSWVCFTAVSASSEILRLNQMLLPFVVEQLRSLPGAASALLNQGVVSITLEQFHIEEMQRQAEALVTIRAAVIDKAPAR